MKKDYIKIKQSIIPIYRGYLVIVLSNSYKEINKIIPEYDSNNPYAHAYFSNFKGRQGFFMILNFDNKYSKILHGTIAHEALHLAIMICKQRGIRLDTENDEPIAYLAEWITDEAYKHIHKNGFKAS